MVMKSKQLVRALLIKMPGGVTLKEIVSWMNTVDMMRVNHSEELTADLEKDLAAYFSKKEHGARASRESEGVNARKKVLNMLAKLPEETSLQEILNILVLLRRIELGIEESERGEGIDHDEFFKELCKDDEENTRVVAARGPQRPPRNKKTNRETRPEDRRKVRPAS